MATTPALAAIAALLLLGPAAAQNTFSGQFLLTDSSGGTPAELVAVVYDMFPPSPHDDIPAPRYDVGGTLELKGFDVLPSPQTAVPLFRASGTEAVFVASGKGGKPGFRAVTAQFYEFDQPNVTAEVALDPTVATGSYDSTWAATLQLDTKANKLWAVRSSDAKGNEFGSFDMASGKWTPEFALDGSNAEDWLVSAWAQKAQVFTVLSISGTNSSDVHSYVIHVDELSNVTGRVQKYTVADPQYFDLKQDSFRQLSFDPLTGIAWFVRPSGGMEGPVVDLYGLNIFDTQGDSMLLTGPVEGGGEGVSVCSKQSVSAFVFAVSIPS